MSRHTAVPLPVVVAAIAVAPLLVIAPKALAHSAHTPAQLAPAVGVQTICAERVHFNAHDILIDGQFRGLFAVQARAKEATGQCAKPVVGLAKAEKAVQFALAQVGDRYVYGATGPNAWDCSSLIQAAYRSAGVHLPRVSSAQARAGFRVPLSQIRRGDIVVYRGHVALALGGGKQVAATKPRTGVRVQGIYAGALYGVRVS